MSSSVLMANFNKKLIDFEAKVTRHGEKIEALQDATKRIESQLEQNKNEFKKNQENLSCKVDQAMVMLTRICDKLKITPDRILQNNEATQHLNSPDSPNSSDSHEKPESPKASSIPHQQNSNTNFQNMQLWNQFSNIQLVNQYPLFTPAVATYQQREKLELSKFDDNKKCSVAWFIKQKNI